MHWRHVLCVGLPVAGIVIAVALPLARYAARERDERAALEVVQRVQAAQRAFYHRTGAYATTLVSLTTGCDDGGALSREDVAGLLDAADYVLELRMAQDGTVVRADCHGEVLASDYYVAVAPAHAAAAGRQAMAARADGRIYLFHDGLAPRERDFERGLATPVEAREEFRIP